MLRHGLRGADGQRRFTRGVDRALSRCKGFRIAGGVDADGRSGRMARFSRRFQAVHAQPGRSWESSWPDPFGLGPCISLSGRWNRGPRAVIAIAAVEMGLHILGGAGSVNESFLVLALSIRCR